jgi:hypothetical protein
MIEGEQGLTPAHALTTAHEVHCGLLWRYWITDTQLNAITHALDLPRPPCNGLQSAHSSVPH